MATICAGARATYDALEAAVRPSESCFLDARGIAGDPPHVQRNALRRYAAMDKTWANFKKDWGYMACVKSARGHARAPAPPQPRPAAPRRPVTKAPTTPQPRPAPRRAVITPPPVPSLPPATASESDEEWFARRKGAADAKK